MIKWINTSRTAGYLVIGAGVLFQIAVFLVVFAIVSALMVLL